jgi:hypothetical protein
LLVHSIRVARLAEKLAADYYKFERPDRVKAAGTVHDIDKGGLPWQPSKPGELPDSAYVADHGPVAAEWLKGLKDDECGADCDAIIDDVSIHMAQWNKPVATPPQTLEEQIISYADYLASQDDVYVQWRTP